MSKPQPDMPNPPRTDEAESSDSDLAGMPPGIVMPDEAEFRRGQYLARLITESIAFCIVVGLLLLPGQREHARLLLVCAGVVAAIAAFDLVRYLRARRGGRR